MDGTLLDSAVAVPAAYVAAVGRLGGPALHPDQVVGSYSVGPSAVLLAHLLGRELRDGEIEVYYSELAGAIVGPYPGIGEVICALQAAGQPVAVFTGASRRAACLLLSAAGIAADVLVGGDEVAHPKPAPDGLLLVAQRLDIAPGRLAYIGDAPVDLLAATAAGAVSAAAAWGHQYDSAVPADVTLARPADALELMEMPRLQRGGVAGQPVHLQPGDGA